MAFALILVPGRDWAFVLVSSAADRVVLPAVGGLLIGYGMLTGASPVLTVLTALGAGYLTYLGVSLLRNTGSLRADPDPARLAGASAGSHVLRGRGVSGLNPKGLLIFLAVLPQFIDARGVWPVRVQLAALGLVFVATRGCFYTIIGLAARAVLSTKSAGTRLVSRLSGTAMIVLGVIMLVERIHQLAR